MDGTEELLAATPEFQDWKMDKVYYRAVKATREAIESGNILDIRTEMTKITTVDGAYTGLLAVVDRFMPL